MSNRILGIDLSDSGTILTYYDEERSWSIPTVLCKEKNTDSWLVGESAYDKVLNGKGILTDKLLRLFNQRGSSTIDNTKYSSKELLRLFFKLAIEMTIEGSGKNYPDEIVVTLPEVNRYLVDGITEIFIKLGYLEDHIHVISRSESFIYYTAGMVKDINNKHVGMFVLSDISLIYYELKVSKSAKSTIIYADKLQLDEGFQLDVLQTPSGRTLADNILTSCAQRIIGKKIYSAIILSGDGFQDLDWAQNFIKFIGARRRVFVDTDVFARGACLRGAELAEGKSNSFTTICDGRLDSNISIDIVTKDRPTPFSLAKLGDTWYDIDNTFTLIPDNTQTLDISVHPLDNARRKVLHIPLDFLPKRPNKATKIEVNISFTDEHTMRLKIRDIGFGELFPATEASMDQEVRLWD